MEEEKKKLCAQYLLPSCDITPRKPLDRCNMSETSHSGSTEGLQQTLHVWSSRHDPSHVDAQTHRETSYATTWWIYYSNSSCSACSVHHGNTASMHHGTNVSHFTEKGNLCYVQGQAVHKYSTYNTEVSTDNKWSCSTFSKDTGACGGICTSRLISSTTDLYSDIRVKSLKICPTTVGCITINHSIPKPPTAPQTESSYCEIYLRFI